MKIAAIDIGSNAIRLYIARPLHEDLIDTDFKSVEFTRLPLRLGDDVFKTKEISKRKYDLLLKAMQAFALLMEIYNVDQYRVCATSAMRDAENGEKLARDIRKTTGLKIDIITGKNKESWSPDSLTCVISLRDRGVMQGKNVVEFTHPVSDSEKARVLDRVEDFCIPISLYLSFQNHAPKSFNPSKVSFNDSQDVATDQLSARQVSILRGMVEGKTNHELATELGFSVSTVRHETMRIYQALGVSDRKEAAKKALVLGIV